jgi:polysaccharide biosynthesis protein PslH
MPDLRPSVLYLTNNLPIPAHSGGQVRELQLLKRLASRFAVHLVAFVQDKAAAVDSIPEARAFLSSVELGQVEPGAAPPELPHRVRAHYARDGAEIIRTIAARVRPRIVHLEGYFLARYLELTPGLRSVVVAENVEFLLEQGAETVGSLNAESAVTRSVEIETWRRAGKCVGLTPEDADVIRRYVNPEQVSCIPNGVDHLPDGPAVVPCEAQSGPWCLYTANFAWSPSRDAAEYLIREVWPCILRLLPRAQLMLAGAAMDASLATEAASTPRVRVQGVYESFHDVATQASVFVYPLRFGGGIKVKIVEALSAGLPLVTTPTALRGFPTGLTRYLQVANSPEEFASAVAAVLADMPAARARARSARELLKVSMPAWAEAAAQLGAVWQELIDG